MPSAADLPWGPASLDVEAPAIWGARTVVKHGVVEISYDRQGVVGGEAEARIIRATVLANWALVAGWAREAQRVYALHRPPEVHWHRLGNGEDALAVAAVASGGYVNLLACAASSAPQEALAER